MAAAASHAAGLQLMLPINGKSPKSESQSIFIPKIEPKMEKSKEVSGAPIPHVIVLPYPSQGHINPLLQFAKRLAAKGVRATIVATATTASSIHAAAVAVEQISDGRGSAKAGGEEEYLTSLREHGSKSLAQLLDRYRSEGFPVDCVIYDAFFPWALDVAHRHGATGAAFFTNSAAVCAIFSHIHGGTLELPVNVDGDGPLILPGLPPLNSCDVPTFIRNPQSYPAYLAMKLSQFSNLAMADFVFANSFQALEGQEAKSVEKNWPAKLVGPMVPSAYLDERIDGDKGYGASLWKPLSEQCAAWLDTKPRESVVYVSFGSMVSLTAKQTEEIAHALMSGTFNFLWVVRDTEREKLPAGFANTDGKGLVVPWCNQLETLAHPAIGCFVTHCGWNSTLEGLALGVPMVALPQWSDQMTDAKFIEEIWGLGMRAKEDEFGIARREEVVYCLKEVMEGERREEMRRNARKWRELAVKATDEGGSSDISINEFVMKLMERKGYENC